jgi:hypothetical protein
VDELEGCVDGTTDLTAGDVIEFTHRGERRTAEVMIVSGDQVLLDLFDGDRPAFARLGTLVDVAVYRPDDAPVAA